MNRNSNESSGMYKNRSYKRDFNHEEEETDNKEENSQESEKQKEYVRELIAERLKLDQENMPKITRLVEQEMANPMGKKFTKYVNVYRDKPIKVSVKVLIPIKEHPKFNFVGKLLGPKGNTLKRLQEETLCKMSVLGKGSMKNPQKEEELKASLDPKYAHLFDELHVEISAYGPPAEAHARIAFALAEVRKYLIPDNNDMIRQEQLREMEMIGATPAMDKLRGPPKRPGFREDFRGPNMRQPPAMRTATRGPVDSPRVMPAKTKIMSILDRARMAMEEGPEEYYEPEPHYNQYNSYDAAPSPPSYGHHQEPEYQPDFYRGGRSSGGYGGDSSGHRWKTFKTSNPPGMNRHGGDNRYRPSPYSRPMK